jgi:hypothetical protein
VSGQQRIKRKPGPKKGTTKLPPSYWLAILQTVDEVRHKRGLSVEAACRAIIAKGGLAWVAPAYGPVVIDFKTLAQIRNAKVLSNRYYQALRFVRTRNIPTERPHIPSIPMIVMQWTGGRENRLRKAIVRHERLVFMQWEPQKALVGRRIK